jgi:hypothetical protein
MSRKRHDVRLWIFVRRCRSGRTDLGLQNSSFVDRKTDSQSVGFSLNGTPVRIATLHVTHSKDERGSESGLKISSNMFILNKMAERVGFEFTRKRSFNNMERTAGTVKHWKALVSSANGSQTDHSLSVADHPLRER